MTTSKLYSEFLEETYRLISENTNDLIRVLNNKFKIQYINEETHARILGYNKEELMGKFADVIIHPDEKKEINGFIRSILKKGQSKREGRLKHKDGRWMWFDIQGNLFKDSEGNLKALLISRDITDRKKAEEKFKIFFKGSIIPTYAWQKIGKDFIMIDYNEAAVEITHGGVERFIGINASEIYRNRPKILGDIKRCYKDKVNIVQEMKYKMDTSKQEKDLLIKYVFLPPNLVLVHTEDITERKVAELRLKESEEIYRTLTEQSFLGIAILQDDRIQYVNNQLALTFGYTVEEIISWERGGFLNVIYPEDRPKVAEQGLKKQTGDPNIVDQYQFRGITKNGDQIWLEIFSKTIDYRGKLADFITIHDITEEKKNTQKNIESEEKYRSLFNNAPFAIVLFNIKGIIIDCNDATELVTGYSKEDLVGNNFRDFNFYVDTELADIETRESQVKKGKTPGVREILLHKKDGSQFWARNQIEFVKIQEETCIQAIIHDVTEQKKVEKQISDLAKFPSENPNPVLRVNKENIIYINKAGRILFDLTEGDKIPQVLGEIIINTFDEDRTKIWEGEIEDEYYSFNITPIIQEGYVNIYGRNITERKKSEIALNLEKLFVDDILNSSMDTIFVFDPATGKAMRWNKVFTDVTGYSDEEISSMKVPDSYYSEEDLKIASKETRKLLEEGKTTFEMSLITKDGRKIPYEYTGTTLKDSDGKLLIVSVGRDLTERREAENKLKESEAKFRGIFETIPDIFFLMSNDGTILDYKGTIEELYVPPEEFLGKKIFEVLPKSIAELSLTMLNKTIKTHEPQTLEYNLNIQGETHFYEARHLYFPEDRVLAFIRDITERRKAEEKLLISEKKYREAFDRANFYKDLFSHDINNILQVVNSSAELIAYQLGDSEKSQDIANIAEIIKKQVDRGSKLVTNVRTLSKLDEEEIPTKPIDISGFLENSIDFIGKAYEERNVKITIEGLKGNFNLNANEFIQDVFENILINSIKYNENSKIEITVRVSKLKIDRKSHYKLEFLDNGIGVPDNRKEAIFLSGNRELKGSKGMGLGLSLVSKIIQIFNGKIWVEDKVKGDYTQGSNFILLLPEA